VKERERGCEDGIGKAMGKRDRGSAENCVAYLLAVRNFVWQKNEFEGEIESNHN
jgi:hypothetical protein